MAAATFDTLKYANTLKAAGVPDKQAEAQASVLGEALAVNFKDLASKDHVSAVVNESEQRLNAKIDALEQRLNAKMDSLAARIDGQITLMKWMIGLAISLNVAVLVRLFFVRVP